MPQTPYNQPIPVAYSHISNAGTFAVKSAAGALFSLNINSGTSGATITMFDQSGTNTGTVDIAVINIGSATVALPARIEFGPSDGGIKLANGLAVLTTGTVDLTIGYK